MKEGKKVFEVRFAEKGEKFGFAYYFDEKFIKRLNGNLYLRWAFTYTMLRILANKKEENQFWKAFKKLGKE